MPYLYMRLGKFDESKRVIMACISAKAYDCSGWTNPKATIGREYLRGLKRIKDASSAVLQYVSDNPGVLQRNIYKTFKDSSVTHDDLYWVLRYSYQVKKEKAGNTYKLYTNTDINNS